jgi:hypothetical protein
MRASIIYYLVLASAVPFLNLKASLAQELSAEERACIVSAAAKLPQAAALKVERSRAYPEPQTQGRRNTEPYRVLVRINVDDLVHSAAALPTQEPDRADSSPY